MEAASALGRERSTVHSGSVTRSATVRVRSTSARSDGSGLSGGLIAAFSRAALRRMGQAIPGHAFSCREHLLDGLPDRSQRGEVVFNLRSGYRGTRSSFSVSLVSDAFPSLGVSEFVR